MSVEEQIRTEMREIARAVDPGTALALAQVEAGVRRQRTRRNLVLAAAAAFVAIAGVLWGTGPRASLPGPDDSQPIQQPSEWDGGDWVRVEDTDFEDSYFFTAVTEVDGRLIAVGESVYARRSIFTSVDGSNWTPADTPDGTPTKLSGVIRGGPGVIAFGQSDGTDAEAGVGHAVVWTSPDGLTWTPVDAPDGVFDVANSESVINAVTVGGPGFVAVGARHDQPAVWTSPDGFEWVLRELDWTPTEGVIPSSIVSESPGYLTEVMTGGLGLMATGEIFDDSGGRYGAAWTSGDGTSWSRAADNAVGVNAVSELSIHHIMAAGPGLVAFGWDGSVDRTLVWTSDDDGRTWTRFTEEQHGLDGDVMRVIDTGDGFVAVGWRHEPRPPVYPDDAAVWTSADAVTWHSVTDESLSGPGAGINDITETRTGLVAVGLTGYERGLHDSTTAAVWVLERP